jgi:transcriptional regulator with XRE-family HTH domain
MTEDVNLRIGRRLSARRLSLGLSLADVAARCGVTLQQIHRYEIGANTISAPMLLHLARCLDVDVAYFFAELEAEPVRRLKRS